MTDNTNASIEPMRLRAEPPRVTRLSRKVLAGVGAAALLGIGGALIYALQSRDPGPGGEELYSIDNRPTADGLTGLPRDYTGPLLGPPLPGDLGGPILDAQNRGQPIAPPAMAMPAVDPDEERRRAEEEAARLSTVFFQSGPRPGAGPGTAPGLADFGLAGLPGQAPTQDRQTAFLTGPADRQVVALNRVMAPASPYILQAGAVISAALITGIRSDLPGQITAQVTENVERQPGADASGFAGLEDGVDNHWAELLQAAGLSTLLAVGVVLAVYEEDRLVRALRDGAQDTINQAGQAIVQRQLQVAPTLTIRPGFPVRVIVTRDLVLEPYRN
ncbi:MAG: conjugal transfer protein TraI [Rhizobiales bacterium 32-66-8]|nr:MAG: conjugal transfer protein TraI [Rhizobiales bacterium 32-66-8]